MILAILAVSQLALWILTRILAVPNVLRLVLGPVNIIGVGILTSQRMRGTPIPLDGWLVWAGLAVFVACLLVSIWISGLLISEGLSGRRYRMWEILKAISLIG